jgi:hypothetical protein
MMMKENDMQTITMELPRHWASALNYGEMDGLDEEEAAAVEIFTKDMVRKYGLCWCLEVSNDRWFQRFHDATEYGIPATDVSTFTFDITPE